MKPEDLKKLKDEALNKQPSFDPYDCPIDAQLGAINTMIYEEYDRKILRAVAQMGISIDKEGLVEAINADHKRYDAAYHQGWNDCKKYYEERLREIHELSGKPVDIYD